MKFDEIINSFHSENSKNSYRDLNFFLEKLIEHYFIKNKIEYFKLDSTGMPFDYIIENDCTIDDLIEKVREILIKENIIND